MNTTETKPVKWETIAFFALWVSLIFFGFYTATRLDSRLDDIEAAIQQRQASTPQQPLLPSIQNDNRNNIQLRPDIVRPLSTEEVASELGVNADTVHRRHKAGTLAGYVYIGRNAWVRESWILTGRWQEKES